MRMLNADQVRAALDYPGLVAALAAMLRDLRAGAAQAPQRTVAPLPLDGSLLVMPAADAELAMTKLVTVHPRNANLPVVQTDVLVCSARTGERLMLLDGEAITGRRTAALSALAARTLAPGNAGPLLLIGAGAQAAVHLEAFAAVLGVTEVSIASRTERRALSLADHATSLGLRSRIVADPAEALDDARLIVTATTSETPVLPAAVRADALIAAVGAFRPSMAEIPPDLALNARVYVDTLDGARAEAGDLIQADLDWAEVIPLADALDQPPPPAGRPILFKSVGHALWDLAAVKVIVEGLKDT
ncbi:MAG TPA: delta(1)-pyrroline-2-carboxylate reductase family protein [Herpetosiphonaceae bacterium]|nr:delta(1)-pyrroline-2-carboxylate reductase family protein [Herpetosiphonaceae bacterium]